LREAVELGRRTAMQHVIAEAQSMLSRQESKIADESSTQQNF